MHSATLFFKIKKGYSFTAIDLNTTTLQIYK